MFDGHEVFQEFSDAACIRYARLCHSFKPLVVWQFMKTQTIRLLQCEMHNKIVGYAIVYQYYHNSVGVQITRFSVALKNK